MTSEHAEAGGRTRGQALEALLMIPVFAIRTVLLVIPLWAEFGGLYHAYAGHGLGHAAVAFFFPPYAWYRSAEFFWHESPADRKADTARAWERLGEVTDHCNRATKSLASQGFGVGSASEFQEISDAWADALVVARTIDVAALDRGDPGIGSEFESKLLQGLELCVNHEGNEEFLRGQALLDQWGQAFNARRSRDLGAKGSRYGSERKAGR